MSPDYEFATGCIACDGTRRIEVDCPTCNPPVVDREAALAAGMRHAHEAGRSADSAKAATDANEARRLAFVALAHGSASRAYTALGGVGSGSADARPSGG